MNLKELAELKELIAEREKLEVDFVAGSAKLDAKIAGKVSKLQTGTEPKPVDVVHHKRRERSDKGRSRGVKLAEPPEHDPDEPIGEVVGQIKIEEQQSIDNTFAALDSRG